MLALFFSFLTVFALVKPSSTAPAEKKSIWSISLARSPAPPPEEGPAATASTFGDPSKLKYEVVGIVCAYLFWIALTAVALLVVGRRFRRRQQSSDQTLGMETIKPTGRITLREIEAGPKSPLSQGQFSPGILSPKSPGKMASIRSWAKGHKGKTSEASFSTMNSRIDERVLEHDKARNMDDMAKLYAAVMAHDEEKSVTQGHSSSGSSPIIDDHTPATPRTPRTPRSPQYPPQMAHPAYVPPMPQYYPESQYEPMPPPPIPESDESSLLDGQTPRKTKNSAMSIISSTTSRLGSSQSNKVRPAPITVRGQPISKPLGSADLRQSTFSNSQASLPSVYSPGPPPPTPGKAPVQVEEIEMHGRPQLTSLASDDSVNKQVKTLPFRQFYQDSLKSAPPTKTTFLDRRVSNMNGPKTGVPKTPYSPYCPTTPMTPITPRRLLNKEEIKKNKKQYALKVVKENDLVQSDNDMWGTD